MRHFITLILLLIFSISIWAERIGGPANIRREPNGEKFVTLYDSVEVTCTEIKNGWYQVGFSIKLTKEQYEQSKITIPAGTKLYNMKNEPIGESLINLTFSCKSMGGPPNNRWYSTDFFGYTFKTNIRPESIPEPALCRILNEGKQSFTIADFMDFIETFDFENDGILHYLDNKYDEYMIYENWIDDPSPIDRIRLIFDENHLVAVIHSRELDVNNFSSYDLTRGLKIMIIEKMADKQRDEFIELNKKSYSGVD